MKRSCCSLGSVMMFDYNYELFKLALKGMNIGTGGSVDESGEINVIDFIAKYSSSSPNENPVIFDVGANIGSYLNCILKMIPQASVHAFEASVHTFEVLKKNLACDNVVLNNVAIGNECGKATLYADKEESGLASLYKRQLDYLGIKMDQCEEVDVITIDTYCEEKGIRYIDLLKMDIEGHELFALQGASKMLADNRIAAVQIEFGGCNIDSRTYFRDFWNLLHNKFNIYRIMRDGFWHIKKYTELLEIFTTTNYLFVNKEVDI